MVGGRASCPLRRVPQALALVGGRVSCPLCRVPRASALVGGAGILPASSRTAGVGPCWGAGILPASSSAAGFPSALLISAALILSGLCLTSASPALGNLRQLRPSQSGNLNARKSSSPTLAIASNGISESPTHCPTRFVTAIVSDGHGGVWVSGEDFGIYHGVAAGLTSSDAIGVKAAADAAALAKKPPGLPRFHWHHFDVGNSPGLASNFVTALCVDGHGRLWAGTNRHGVAVFNSKKWKHYNIITGPLGSHVYALAYNAIANQVWIATENGISIYQCGKSIPSGNSRLPSAQRYAPHTWHYITAMDGLPPNPDCIAFDSHGRAFVGTQCNGLAIGTSASALPMGKLPGQPFAKRKLTWRWRVITGPEHISQLRTAYGYGLPGNLINCVLVTPANHIYVGTDWGLAYSTNDGKTFRYERGQDYAAKIMGLWHPPQGYRPPPQGMLNGLLPGDHITCLAQDLTGDIWIGTWRNGYEVLNPETGKEFKSEDSPALAKADGYISQLCPITEISIPKSKSDQPGLRSANRRRDREIPIPLDQTMLVGRYGFGVHEFGRTIEKAGQISRVAWQNLHHRPAVFKLPQVATPPTPRQWAAMKAILRDPHRSTSAANKIVALPDDWITQGNWIDRYGTFADVCATMNGDGCDQAGGYHNVLFSYRSWVGPGNGPAEFLRYWVQWVHSGQNRVLQDLGRGGRKESEWDDHGESAAFTESGMGVYCTFYLPKGIFKICSYSLNKDGHAGTDRERDYIASLCATPISEPLFLSLAKNYAANEHVWQMVNNSRALAQSRVAHFWGGVYARFIVRQNAPGYLTLAVHRDYSFNTIVCGVFISHVNGGRHKKLAVFTGTRLTLPAGKFTGRARSAGGSLKSLTTLVNSILAFRRRHAVAYMRLAPALVIPALRCFRQQLASNGLAVRRVIGLRRGLALLARDIALFHRAEGIDPIHRLYESYAYKMRAKLGKYWQWDQNGYYSYMKKKRKQFIASR